MYLSTSEAHTIQRRTMNTWTSIKWIHTHSECSRLLLFLLLWCFILSFFFSLLLLCDECLFSILSFGVQMRCNYVRCESVGRARLFHFNLVSVAHPSIHIHCYSRSSENDVWISFFFFSFFTRSRHRNTANEPGVCAVSHAAHRSISASVCAQTEKASLTSTKIFRQKNLKWKYKIVQTDDIQLSRLRCYNVTVCKLATPLKRPTFVRRRFPPVF